MQKWNLAIINERNDSEVKDEVLRTPKLKSGNIGVFKGYITSFLAEYLAEGAITTDKMQLLLAISAATVEVEDGDANWT